MLSRILINQQYARLWFSGAVSWVGDYVFDTTVLLWIATVIGRDKTWAPAATAGVLLATLVPLILISPVAGVFVDRWDLRRTMLASDAIRGLLVAALVALPLLPAGTVPVPAQLACVYAVVFVTSAVSRFFTPARFAIVADVVPPEQQARASGIGQATMGLAGLIGPPLAAPLLFTAGIQWALIVDAVSFAISFAAIYLVRVPARPGVATASTGVWSELRAGATTFLASRVLLAVAVASMIANFGANILNTLDVFFVRTNLHANPSLYGFLETAFGLGAIIGALLGGAVGQRFGLSRTYWLGVLLTGVAIVGYARTSTLAVALGVLLLAGIPVSAANSMTAPIVMRAVPREMLGRAFAFLMPAVQLSGLVSVGLAGWLASSALRGLDARVAGVHFGPYDTAFTAGGILIVLGGLYAMVALRGTDRAPAPVPEPVTEPVAEPA
jgi:MFS family permease